MFFAIDDVNTDRKHIEKIYNSENVTPIISSSYNSRYNDILKSLCSNSILCKPSVYNAEQETYSFLLNRINNDEMVLYGESTLYIILKKLVNKNMKISNKLYKAKITLLK